MKARRIGLLALLVPLFIAQLAAQKLSFAGVLGNSGEQGSSLVRFAPLPAHGLGAIFDGYGTVWDRAGSGLLNRYAVDGRLVASYPLPEGERSGDLQTLTPAGVLLLIGSNLYLLPLDQAAGTKPRALGISATAMSFATSDGSVALLQGNGISILDAKTLTLKSAVPNIAFSDVSGLALLDDHSIVIQRGENLFNQRSANLRLFRDGHEVTDGWPKSAQGRRLQHIGQFWYAEGYHGTVYRYDEDFEAAPGVVLGGGSGSFLGHVEGDEELSLGNGVAILGEGTAAVSGKFGIVELMQWNASSERYDVARRLGAAPGCKGLAINDAGAIWFNSGRWNWDDLPASPLRDSIAGGGYLAQVAALQDGTFLAAMQHDAGIAIVHGTFNWNSKMVEGTALTERMLNAATVYRRYDGKSILLFMDSAGQGTAFGLDSNNLPGKEAVRVEFEFASPVHNLTTLATKDNSLLLAAADGNVIELEQHGDVWHELSRWNAWGPADRERFGPQIHITTDDDHLWVADTGRNRVLCFSLQTRKLIGSYGRIDQAGNDLLHLSSPTTIAARHNRAVVFDEANQRVVKIMLNEAH